MMADKASPTRAVLDKRLVVEIGIGWYLVGLVGIPVISRPSSFAGPRFADESGVAKSRTQLHLK